jgi:hypothetical protein
MIRVEVIQATVLEVCKVRGKIVTKSKLRKAGAPTEIQTRFLPAHRISRPSGCTSASYSVPRFKSRPEDRLSWLDFSMVSLSLSRQMSRYYLRLSHDRILPHPLQFIIYKSSYDSILCSLSYGRHRLKTINKEVDLLVFVPVFYNYYLQLRCRATKSKSVTVAVCSLPLA